METEAPKSPEVATLQVEPQPSTLAQLLVGNINYSGIVPTSKNEFLNRLALLLQEYRVAKIDVSWCLVPTVKPEPIKIEGKDNGSTSA